MPPGPRRCPVPWGGGFGARGADLPALSLPPLRRAGVNLQAMRSRQRLLSPGVCGAGSARLLASRRCSLSTHLPRGLSACRPAASLLRAGSESDASPLLSLLGCVQRVGPCQRADPCRASRTSRAAPSGAPDALRVLRNPVASLRSGLPLALERMSVVMGLDGGYGGDLARARGRDPAAVSR